MMRFAIKNLSSMLITAALSVSAVHADDTGFASIHAWRSERGITCMVDHFHSGNGEGRTKKAALRSAIASWEGFTAWEYGADWARIKSAGGRGGMEEDRPLLPGEGEGPFKFLDIGKTAKPPLGVGMIEGRGFRRRRRR